MEPFRIVLCFILGFIILFFAMKNINRTGSYDGFTNTSYANCSNISNCKTCASTLTANDGVCYWCSNKCVAGGSKDYNPNTCHSDSQKCSKDPVPPPDPSPPEPDPSNCPKLILLDTPTWMTAQ